MSKPVQTMIVFGGGENHATPAMGIPPGELRFSQNYEIAQGGGYKRIDGYERFDGHPRPSDASYWVLPFHAGVSTMVAGDTVIGEASGAKGVLLMDAMVSTGSWLGEDAEGRLILTGLEGEFQDHEEIHVSATPKAMVNGSGAIRRGADEDGEDDAWFQNSVEIARGKIASVPGSGKILGVWMFHDVVYAFRNNEQGTACGMWRASESGWEQVDLGGATLNPNGNFEFTNYNFIGHAGGLKMYGCDGVNKGFQFDGVTFTFIETGMTNDAPTHLACHKKHLFFSFDQGSLQHSAIGNPLDWTPISGAGEIGTGAEVTGLVVTQGLLVIFNRDRTYLLYGTSSSDWQMTTHSDDSGAFAGTIQLVGTPKFLHDRGLMSLDATPNYGDFQMASFSRKIHPVIQESRRLAVSSISVRTKNQYRLFLSNKVGIMVNLGSGSPEFTRVLYNHVVSCTCSVDSNAGERMFFGSDNGFVYEMDAGTSFDGESIEAFLQLAYYSFKTPGQKKRFRQINLDVIAPRGASLQFQPDFNYSAKDGPAAMPINVNVGGGSWDISNWGEFNWSSPTVGSAVGNFSGIGSNLGILFYSKQAYEQPHTLLGATITYSLLGREKN